MTDWCWRKRSQKSPLRKPSYSKCISLRLLKEHHSNWVLAICLQPSPSAIINGTVTNSWEKTTPPSRSLSVHRTSGHLSSNQYCTRDPNRQIWMPSQLLCPCLPGWRGPPKSSGCAKTLSARRHTLRPGMSPRTSGPAGSFTGTSTLGSAICAHTHSRISNSATTASRSISMKVSTRLTMEKSGLNARAAKSGTISSARSKEMPIPNSARSLTSRTTTASPA